MEYYFNQYLIQKFNLEPNKNSAQNYEMELVMKDDIELYNFTYGLRICKHIFYDSIIN